MFWFYSFQNAVFFISVDKNREIFKKYELGVAGTETLEAAVGDKRDAAVGATCELIFAESETLEAAVGAKG